MDFRFADEVEVFRHALAADLAAAMEALGPDEDADSEDLTGLGLGFERRLAAWAGERGILALSLPTEWGGGGLAPSWQAAANLEIARLDAPLIDTALTLMGQPVLAFGTADQRAALLPKMARGEILGCIAYSEPDAGSDLAALNTQAVADGDGFVLSGRKALVTGPHKADWCCTVAVSDPSAPIRQALSMFLVPMDAPGVRVVRRRTMNHWTLGEIAFDDVRLGPEALLGKRNEGWGQLLAAVGTEGAGMFHVGFAHHALEQLVTELDGVAAEAPGEVAETVGDLALRIEVAERLAKRAIWAADNGEASIVAASMAKVVATETLQHLAVAGSELLGMSGTVLRPLFGPGSSHAERDGRMAWEVVERVHGTIGGGTNEMKRNVIARVGLGLGKRS